MHDFNAREQLISVKGNITTMWSFIIRVIQAILMSGRQHKELNHLIEF